MIMKDSISTEEILLSGAPASPGIAMGKSSLYQRSRPNVTRQSITDDEIDHQLSQFEKALEKAEQEIRELQDTQKNGEVKDLLLAHIEMINDPDLRRRVEIEIKKYNQPADAAIEKVFGTYLDLMENQKGVLQERSIDIKDVRDRLIQIINDDDEDDIERGSILIAPELSPREVIEFSEQNICGIVMDRGGTTSHAAILARSMHIPTVVGVENASSSIGAQELIILDGDHGEVVVNPTPDTQKRYDELMARTADEQSRREKICSSPNTTSDGSSFLLQANIEFEEELASVRSVQAEGIGLLRTESLYLRHEQFGDEKKQKAFYQSILEGTKPHAVTIRLFDAGGDKFFDQGQQEHNPFLGWRGIRMLLDERSLFKEQLRAILETAVQYPGRVRLLVPMISSLQEVSAIKQLIKELEEQLLAEKSAAEIDIELGIMVEVPAVAMQAEYYAEQVDFLSIGTNDLTQYLLAVDRGNERISGLYNQRHPAVWKMIQHVSKAAQATAKPVCVCGELASDPIAACCLMGLGIKELSMTSGALPMVKNALCSRSIDDMKKLAAEVLESITVSDVEDAFARFSENE